MAGAVETPHSALNSIYLSVQKSLITVSPSITLSIRRKNGSGYYLAEVLEDTLDTQQRSSDVQELSGVEILVSSGCADVLKVVEQVIKEIIQTYIGIYCQINIAGSEQQDTLDASESTIFTLLATIQIS